MADVSISSVQSTIESRRVWLATRAVLYADDLFGRSLLIRTSRDDSLYAIAIFFQVPRMNTFKQEIILSLGAT
jgi:hypothetical protein